jgi:hypothetical protein
VRAHYASGDDNLNSAAFHNFTASYPDASVISETISASNVKNLQPYVQFFVSPNAVFGASWNFVRKVTMADSVYGPIGTIITAREFDRARRRADRSSRFDAGHFALRATARALCPYLCRPVHQRRGRSQLGLFPAADPGPMVS